MNLSKLKLSGVVRLRPQAHRQYPDGQWHEVDEDWSIEVVNKTEGFLELKNLRSFTRIRLNADHVHHWTSDSNGLVMAERGFLLVHMKVRIDSSNGSSIEPLTPYEQAGGKIALPNSASGMQQNSDAVHRPWINVSANVDGPLWEEPNGEIRAKLLFQLTNVGQSPAADVILEPQLLFAFGDIKSEMAKMAAWRDTLSPTISGFGDVIFPRTSKSFGHEICTRLEQTQDFDFRFKGDRIRSSDRGLALLKIAGHVFYKFAFSRHVHVTPFAYDIFKIPDTGAPLVPGFSDFPLQAGKWNIRECMGGFVNLTPD